MKKKEVPTLHKIDTYLVVGGLCLVFGWALLLGATDWLTHLSCTLSPTSCGDGLSLAKFILYTPAVIGSVLLPIGIVRSVKMSAAAKMAAIITIPPVSLFIAFWLMIFVGIGIYGFGG